MSIAANSKGKSHRSNPVRAFPRMARVLLADDNPASRLTLQTVLEAGGYRVDSAASAAEAVGLLDQQEYALVLTDLAMESPEAGLKVLEHARMKDYHPATALVHSWHQDQESGLSSASEMLIEPEDIPELLSKVAHLIGTRALRRFTRRPQPLR
ncbi:MAG TPA: response regulator [Bryobacteraceae bacterium]|nr:response regulator [Bryobacteraceae bacterium]